MIKVSHRRSRPRAQPREPDVDADADVTPAPRPAEPARWILLIHSIAPRPHYLRVKVGRRLQKVGAVAVKNSVYALPASEAAREDLEWIAHEITADGGEASLCEARFIGGLTDDAIEAQFRAARQRDYAALAKAARRIVDGLSATSRLSSARRARVERALSRIRKRAEEIVAIDHFGAPGRLALDGLLRTADDKLRPPKAPGPRGTPDLPSLRQVRGRTWVTRKGIHVDRIASAWLIRRFIDPEATLKYVEARGYAPARGRAALRHVRRRVHARGRPVHVRGAARPAGTAGTRRCAGSPTWSTTSTCATESSGARRRTASPPSSRASAFSIATTPPGWTRDRRCSTRSTGRSSSAPGSSPSAERRRSPIS